ncbi:hypothetical protein QYF61_012439 [Mycteria americana]|uniref:Uncharacterized protein n=1 Tax=Mycteria americana TaxID=33587 RepID=A0AAN7RRI2_MYCAM|nr:hypothetical protein QYF61_012439 [Mycteria americana]
MERELVSFTQGWGQRPEKGEPGKVILWAAVPSMAPRGWRLNHFPGQPVPMLDNPFSGVKFPNIQSQPPLAQLEDISSCPITCYLGEETDPHLSTTSFQAKQPQLPQPLLIRLLLQTLHQLRCPSLYTLQPLNIPLVVGGPKLNTVFEVRPHQCRVQGHDHFPTPAGHTIFDTSQDAIGFLGHLGTLLAHSQSAINQHPQVLLCWAAFQPLFPKPVALHGVAVAQVQDPALILVEPHTIDLGPSIQPVQVPLQSLPTLQQINTPAQLGVICKLTEGALDPFIQIIDKDIKQNWPQHRALGNTACDRPPTGVNSIHHHSLGPAVQPVLYPAKRTPVQAMSSQFLQENAVLSILVELQQRGMDVRKAGRDPSHVVGLGSRMDGEAEVQTNCRELHASSAVLHSRLDEATSQGPATVQATSQVVLISLYDFVLNVVRSSCCRRSAAVFACTLHLWTGIRRAL